MGTALLCALFFRPEAGVSLGFSGYAPGAASNAAFFTVMTMEQTLGRSHRSLVVFVVAIVVAGSICAALRAAVPYRELLAASWLGPPFRGLTTCPWILSFVSISVEHVCAPPHTQRCGARHRPSLCCS
jgi:ABC-type sugar transport system permease subunit